MERQPRWVLPWTTGVSVVVTLVGISFALSGDAVVGVWWIGFGLLVLPVHFVLSRYYKWWDLFKH